MTLVLSILTYSTLSFLVFGLAYWLAAFFEKAQELEGE
jgi:hypothetical protein